MLWALLLHSTHPPTCFPPTHCTVSLPGKRKLVVTDTLFSMDGDFADLPGLAALKARHNFLLAVDDAHGTLVCGER